MRMRGWRSRTRSSLRDEERGEHEPFKSVVSYSNGCFGFQVQPFDCWLSLDVIVDGDYEFEVIGNIYEHPHLLDPTTKDND